MDTSKTSEKALSKQDILALEGAFREGSFWKFTQKDQAEHYAVPQGLIGVHSGDLPYMQQLHTDLMDSREALLDSHDKLMGHKSVASLLQDLSSPAANDPSQKAEMVAELKHMMDSKEYGPSFHELSDNFQAFVSQFSHYVTQAGDTIETMPIQMDEKTSRIDELKQFAGNLGDEVKPYLTNLYTDDKSFLMSEQLEGAVALSQTKMDAVLYQKKKTPEPGNRPEFEDL